VAAQRSVDDATRYSGGDLGYSTLDVLPDAYAAALRGQAPGAVLGPVQGEGGWAVLRIEDRRLETPPTLDQARPLIVRYLTYEGVRQLLEQLRGKAAVEVFLNPAKPAAQPAATPAPVAPSAPPAGTVAP
jgi:peptidyl-prolyl cis-trans isomerase C